MGTGQSYAKELGVNFRLGDLEGVVTPHYNAWVIRVTNYDVAWMFIYLGISINILFKNILDCMQVYLIEL